jgi:acyl-coenzyme A thioesterase PaaI-like protein
MHFSGVSTDIGTTFVRAAKDGETISISAQVQSMGKTLGFTKMDMTSEDGKVIAFGRAYTSSSRNVLVASPGIEAQLTISFIRSVTDHTKFIGRCRNPEVSRWFPVHGYGQALD